MSDPATDPPTFDVDVIFERTATPNRWEAWGFRVVAVEPAEPGAPLAAAGLSMAGTPEPAPARADGSPAAPGVTRWRHRGFRVSLHRDEGEGYYLNLSSQAPVWFVMWRIDDEDPSLACPVMVTLSYNEAARWLDAQERVDNLPLPAEVAHWLNEYTQLHYKPEPKKRRRPASFVPPDQRQ
jgi:hypothetical protein